MFNTTPRERQAIKYFAKYIKGFKKQIAAILVFMLLTSAFTVYIPILEKDLLDKGLMKANFKVIIIYLVVLFAVKFLHELTTSGQDYVATYLSSKFAYNVTKSAFGKLLKFPMNFFGKYHIGEINTRINGDIDSISILVDTYVIRLITDMFTLAGMIVVMIKLNFYVFLIACLSVPVIVITNEKIAVQQKSASRKIRGHIDRKNKSFQEIIMGIREIKYLNIFKWAEREFVRAQNSLLREKMKINKIIIILFIISSRLYELIHIMVYIAAAYAMVKGKLTVGALFAFLGYFDRAVNIVESVTSFNGRFQAALVSMERVYEILEYEDGDAIPSAWQETAAALQPTEQTAPRIAFENVTFGYEEGEGNEILKNVSFEIYKGDKVALVGKNGSGKSTIMNLLLRLFKPGEGTIRLDGVDITGLGWKALTDKISYVPQKSFMFSYTIRENLLLGNSGATDEELWEVLGQVGLADFVQDLEQGLDTRLTMSGGNISGGQLQRLSIARALLRGSEILLLDESTSNIEEKFEEEFIKRIINDYKELTVISIVHKDKLARYFDRVLYLDEGAVQQCSRDAQAI